MNVEILKDLIYDLANVKASLKEGKRDTERGMKNALSGDFDWDTDKVIEELGGAASDACFEIDKASDMIYDILEGLENMVYKVEFDEAAQKAVKNF